MCGRYYLSIDTVKKTGELLKEWNRSLKPEYGQGAGRAVSGWNVKSGLGSAQDRMKAKAGEEFCPGKSAPVLVWNGSCFSMEEKKWGFSGREKNSILFNARAETVLEKPAFSRCMKERRCLVPVSCFYEWNRAGERFTFTGPGERSLLLAGCFQAGEDRDEFTILTVGASSVMLPVHDRMPLIIRQNHGMEWLKDSAGAEGMLKGPFAEIEKKTEYEQLSFFFQEM